MTTPFDKKSPDAIKLLTFDFASQMPDATTLTTPTVVVASVVAGSGVIGDVTISAITVVDGTVTCLAAGGIDGSRYRLQAEVDCSDGQHFEILRDLPVSESAALYP